MTTSSPSAGQPKPPLFRRAGVVTTGVALLALVVGVLFGLRAADATNSAEYKAQAKELAAAKSELAFARASKEEAEASMEDAGRTAADAQDRLAKVLGELNERNAALRKRETDLKKAVRALVARNARLKQTAANLRQREADVLAAEELLAVTTVPGDGSYEVGVEIEGGLYRTAGRTGCRYTVFGDAAGDEILLDNTTAGEASVSLRAGTWFVTRGCAEWTRR